MARRGGYTLFEVVLVMTLVVILIGLGYPTLESAYSGMKLESAADAVRAGWAEAKAHAINDGCSYRFAVRPGQGVYRVAPDTADYWAGASHVGGVWQGEEPPLDLEDELPRGVVFGEAAIDGLMASADASGWTTCALFRPDGTTEDDIDLVISMPGGPTCTLRLRALTGVVTVLRGG